MDAQLGRPDDGAGLDPVASVDAAVYGPCGTPAGQSSRADSPDQLDTLASSVQSAADVLQLPDDVPTLKRLLIRKWYERTTGRSALARWRGIVCGPEDVLALPDDPVASKVALAEEVSVVAAAPLGAKRRRPARILQLTDSTIKRLRVGRNDCGDGSGMFVKLSEQGRLSFGQELRISGTQRRVERGLGSYPAVSFEDAQAAARENQRRARQGEVPPRRHQQVAIIAEAIEQYFTGQEGVIAEATLRDYRMLSDRHLIPALGGLRVDRVRPAELAEAVRPVWKKYRRRGQNLMTILHGAFKWVKGKGYRDDDPSFRMVDLLPRVRREERNHGAVPPEEVGEVVHRARAFESCLPSVVASDPVVALAFEGTILSALRRAEFAGLKWSEVDEKKGVITIPAERMKVKKKPHMVPISPALQGVLDRVRALGLRDPEGHVFVYEKPSRGGTSIERIPPESVSLFLKRLGYRDKTLHGFRSTFTDWGSENEENEALVELSLAHAIPSAVRRRYSRTQLLELRRDLMDRWGRFVTGNL